MAERRLDEALAELNGAGVTAGPIYDIAQFLDDPHVIEREVVVDLPDEDVGTVPAHNIVPRLSRTPGTFRYPTPKLGQDNDEILGDAGVSAEELANLRARGVIG